MAEDHINSPTDYQLMEEEITSSTEKIYILTSSPLPSHLRTVEVKHGTLFSDLNSTGCSSRTINIILILIFVFVTSLTVSIAVYKITEVTGPETKVRPVYVPSSNSSEEPLHLVMTTDRENSTFYHDSNTTEINQDRLSHCAHKCQLYRDEKFKSDCTFERCVCRGRDYQFLTCLPYVEQCKILKGFFPFANFSMDNVSTPVYSCRTGLHTDENQLHILSLYGNHFAKSTLVQIQGQITEPVTLVLANYYPVNWRVQVQGVNIQSVILASQFNIGTSNIEIVPNTQDEKIISKPAIRSMQIPVGFGTDIYNSKTVEMLKLLSEKIGTVRSFTGADYADYISFRINNDNGSNE